MFEGKLSFLFCTFHVKNVTISLEHSIKREEGTPHSQEEAPHHIHESHSRTVKMKVSCCFLLDKMNFPPTDTSNAAGKC